MSKYFFNFDDFETEIKKKLNSQSLEIKSLFKELSKRLLKNNKLNINKVNDLFKDLIQMPFDKIYKNYLSHPIRLADSFRYIKKNFNHEDINFALSHNIIECDFLKILPKKHLNKEQLEKISILTIDRNKENIKNYLNQYYNKIENYSEELILFKSLDKLDNLLLLANTKLSENQIYIIKNELFPRIKNYNTNIACYLNDLVDYIIVSK